MLHVPHNPWEVFCDYFTIDWLKSVAKEERQLTNPGCMSYARVVIVDRPSVLRVDGVEYVVLYCTYIQ